MRAQPTYHVRWRSPLGLTVGLFLFWGALNAFLAIFVPVSLHRGGAGAVGALVLTPEADAALLGRSLLDVARDDARLNAYLVSFMDTMCAQMMAYAIVHLGLTWFALRRGQAWALGFAGAGALAGFVYFIPVVSEFTRFGAPTDGFVFFTAIPIALIVAASALGWYGLRRERRVLSAA
jgi:hypothetical protein